MEVDYDSTALASINNRVRPGSGSASAHIPLTLPLGAVIQSASATIFDSAGSTQYLVYLSRQHLTVGGSGQQGVDDTDVGMVTGGTASNQPVTQTITPSSTAIVSATDSFYLQFNLGVNTNAFCRASVIYTLP
ncbi:MAG: hypothetical protein JWM34_3768 [Ilumatobacteraceae bacterium]|nr:hypothetical protein [Ilumatobacteraceae bacterium]